MRIDTVRQTVQLFACSTPVEVTDANAEAHEQFVLDGEYYIDFTKA